MPKASEIAIELRKFADALDKSPDAETIRPVLNFWHWTTEKDQFFTEVALIPRPAKKDWGSATDGYSSLTVKHETPALVIEASIRRSVVCEIVEPAKPAVYNCPSILSKAEEAALESA
jgi:hypothetical protein